MLSAAVRSIEEGMHRNRRLVAFLHANAPLGDPPMRSVCVALLGASAE